MNPSRSPYYNHFESFLGSAARRRVFEQDHQTPMIQILEYDQVFDGCRVFCSLGLSHFRDQVDGIYEVFLPADAGWKQIPTVLANSLFACIQQQLPLGRGVCIGGIENIDPGFVRTFRKTSVYFTYPHGVPTGFGKVSCEGSHGVVLQAMFISARERQFFLDEGTEAFENLLESRKVDPFHLKRGSAL